MRPSVVAASELRLAARSDTSDGTPRTLPDGPAPPDFPCQPRAISPPPQENKQPAEELGGIVWRPRRRLRRRLRRGQTRRRCGHLRFCICRQYTLSISGGPARCAMLMIHTHTLAHRRPPTHAHSHHSMAFTSLSTTRRHTPHKRTSTVLSPWDLRSLTPTRRNASSPARPYNRASSAASSSRSPLPAGRPSERGR